MVDRMRIAHVTATFPPYGGGTGNVAFHNAFELVCLGHEVHIYTAAVADAPAEEILRGIHVHRLRPWIRYGNAPLLPSLYSHLKGFDLVHLHLPFYGGSETVYVLRFIRTIPLVITYHQDVQLSGLAGVINQVHDRLIGQRLLKRADRACFTSLDYGRVSKLGPLVRSGKLNVGELPNGVDVNHFSPGTPSPLLIKHYDTDGCSVILFVGALDRAHYFKGIDNLIKAIARLQRDDLRLLIVGKGDLQPLYRQRVKELGLNKIIHFPGFVPDDELPEYYRLADVTVLPSTTAGEAFGLVLLESMACYTPVIASNLPGVRTVVSSPDDGYLINPGDIDDLALKLHAFISIPRARRLQMGDTGRRKVVDRYSWYHIGQILERIYIEVMDDTTKIVPNHHLAKTEIHR
ncbi:MAG: glycosyltransferase [Chloroflexi bacterium]|nr:glycosyltransferase [Chloroflexota bacterium]